MTAIRHIAAQVLSDGRRTFADRIWARLDSTSLRQSASSPSAITTQAIDQFETHIYTLAACMEFSSPALFDDYVLWIATLPPNVSPYVCDITAFLREFQQCVEAEFSGDVSSVISCYLERALVTLQNRSEPEPDRLAENPHGQLQRRYLEALLAKRRNGALHLVMEAVEQGTDIQAIYLHVFQPTQHEIGRLWQTGEIDVAQEHYCTAATQFVMSQLQPYFLVATATDKTLVASCVGDELHEVGLRIVADLFEMGGWSTIYLGANAPAVSIANTIVSSKAQVLAISTTMTQHLFGVAEVIRTIRSHRGCEHVKVLVGGYPFNVDPFLWKRVGADADAFNGLEAVHIADRLIISEKQPEADHRQPPQSPIADLVPATTGDTEDDLSRLNNSLITLQRKLNKANVELSALNKANQEKAEALQRADRRKDEFLAMLAHELRGPLAPMELAVALLQMEGVDPSIGKEACRTLKRQLQQVKHLISDLLDASRIAHGKIELRLEPLPLFDVIHRAIEIVHPLIQEKQQTLHVDLIDSAVVVQGDEIRLAQVFANLLTNASKYTHREGTIWLTTRRSRDTVVIEVKDDGVGMEADLLPDVFTAFAQEQRSRRHSMGGLGLGLSLVKQLVDLHSGTVTAASEGADLGSLFTVTLPAMEAAESQAESDQQTSAETDRLTHARRVLIVEDTAGIARITAILFEHLGHQPAIALDGATAIEKFKDLRPEIVVLDLTLPDMSGLEVTREIRKLDPNDSTLIVALTGHDDEEHRQQAKECGCDKYLVKPVDVDQLELLTTHPKLMSANGSHEAI